MYAEPLIVLLTFVASLGFVYGHRIFPTRSGNAPAVLDKFVDSSGRRILPEQMKQADCVAIVPGFDKASAGDYTAFGHGVITCRDAERWSAPVAVTLESSNPAVKIGRQKMDIVMLSMDRNQRQRLLAGPFTIGQDAAAEWGKGRSADPNSKVLFFGRTKDAFAEFDLDGATLKPDHSGSKALVTPKVAQALVNKLAATFN